MASNDNSILNDVKKMCGLPAEDTSFDLDILIHINSTFTTLKDLGVGPSLGFAIEDTTATWADFLGSAAVSDFVSIKSYIYLKVRMLFDPAATSFLLGAQEKMITEFEWRLNARREITEWVDPTGEVPESEDLVLDGGPP